MRAISVREMKAHWSEIEKKLKLGESFEILNRGKPAAKIIPLKPPKILRWPDHLKTAIVSKGKLASDIVIENRGDY